MAGFYIGKFERPYDANIILERIKEIGKSYGYVTLADVHDLIGDMAEYCECKYGWTFPGLKTMYVAVFDKQAYSVHMPAFDWFSDKKDATTVTEFPTAKPKQTEPEPINVTIPADKPEVIERIISALFNNSENIKDHPLFITII